MNQVRIDLPPHSFFLKNLFSQTLHKIFEKLCHFIYYTLYHWLAVFKSCKTLLSFFEKHRYGDLLTGSEFCMWLWRGVRLVAVLAPFSPFSNGLPLCFWSYLGFMDVRFFLCLFYLLSFGSRRWSGRRMWCWGFSFKHCKWYFYHMNLTYAISCVGFSVIDSELWLATFLSFHNELTGATCHLS